MSENLRKNLESAMINTFHRMNPEKKFIELCDTITQNTHDIIKNKWDFFLENQPASFCTELRKFLESLFSNNIKMDKISRDTIYTVNVKFNEDNDKYIFMYAIRYVQSITNERYATLRGSGGYFIVNKDSFKILCDDTLKIYHKIGQDFQDTIIAAGNMPTNNADSVDNVVSTLEYLYTKKLVVKADGTHLRIHKLGNDVSGEYLLMSTQLLEHFIVVPFKLSIDAIVETWGKMQKKIGDGVVTKGLYASLKYFINEYKIFEGNNAFQLEYMTNEHPGFSEEIGVSVIPHDTEITNDMIKYFENNNSSQDKKIIDDINFIQKYSANNPLLEGVIGDLNTKLNEYFEIDGLDYRRNTYHELTKDMIILILILVPSYAQDFKKKVLEKFVKEKPNLIKLAPLAHNNLSGFKNKIVVLLDCLLFYLGHGDVPEGLLLGIEVKVKIQLWKTSHGMISSMGSVFGLGSSNIFEANIPSLISCAHHMNSLYSANENIFPSEMNLKSKFDKALDSIGLFGKVIKIVGSEIARNAVELNPYKIFESLVKEKLPYFDDIKTYDAIFDFDGTVDTIEHFDVLLRLVENNIKVAILTARDEESLLEMMSEMYGDSELYNNNIAKIKIFSIKDQYRDIITGKNVPLCAAVLKSMIVPRESFIFDDSNVVKSMFTFTKLYNPDNYIQKQSSIFVRPENQPDTIPEEFTPQDPELSSNKQQKGKPKSKPQKGKSEKPTEANVREKEETYKEMVLIDVNKLNYGMFCAVTIYKILVKCLSDPTKIDLVKCTNLLNVLKYVTLYDWYKFDLNLNDDLTNNDGTHIILDEKQRKIIDSLNALKGNNIDKKINICLLEGHAGAGKSTTIHRYISDSNIINDRNLIIYAKDLVHVDKNNDKYTYSFKLDRAQFANDLAVEISKLNNLECPKNYLIILDGAKFDNMGPKKPETFELNRQYTKSEFIDIMHNLGRRNLINMLKTIKISDLQNSTIEEYSKTIQIDKSSKSLAAQIISYVCDQRSKPVVLDWSGLYIYDVGKDRDPVNVHLLQNPIFGAVEDEITKKEELHCFTHFNNDEGRQYLLPILFLFDQFDGDQISINKFVTLTKNGKIGAKYFNVELKNKDKYEYSSSLRKNGHVTISVDFVGGAALLHNINNNNIISNDSPMNINVPISLIFKYKDQKVDGKPVKLTFNKFPSLAMAGGSINHYQNYQRKLLKYSRKIEMLTKY